MMYTVVQVRSGCEVVADRQPLVIVLAVNDGGDKIEWRTDARVCVGDRFEIDVRPWPL